MKQATTQNQSKTIGPLNLSFLAVLTGVVAGIGAVVFRGLIALFHNLLFLGKFSIFYDANAHTPPSPWGLLIILVPVFGALGVAFLVKNFAPEAKGHGVPEVMDAIYYARGKIRPVVAVVKSLASAISIGSGGSVGREGPIIQIGSTFGSMIGQIIRMPAWQRNTLIAAGAGGGIAATFNTPVGGVLFAMEILLHEVSARTIVPVAISTATATYVGRIFFGVYPSFMIPALENYYFQITNPEVLISYVGLGVLMGAVSILFIKCLYGFEDFFNKLIKKSYYIRHMIGMLAVGIIMYLMMITFGHYYIEGVGYSTIQDILTGRLALFYLLIILFLLKLLATSLTLGSGASGGIFSPALYMGATLGGAYGVLLQWLFPGLLITPPAFAVAGMAGMFAGATGAAMAAIVLIFEMTLDYNVIIPMTITVAIAYGTRKYFSQGSIYTLKLFRRGHYMPQALNANIHHLKRMKELVNRNFGIVEANNTIDEFSKIVSQNMAISCYLVKDTDVIIGVITKEMALEALEHSGKARRLREFACNYLSVTEDTELIDLIIKMRSSGFAMALVISEKGVVTEKSVLGFITKEQIADSIAESLSLFSE